LPGIAAALAGASVTLTDRDKPRILANLRASAERNGVASRCSAAGLEWGVFSPAACALLEEPFDLVYSLPGLPRPGGVQGTSGWGTLSATGKGPAPPAWFARLPRSRPRRLLRGVMRGVMRGVEHEAARRADAGARQVIGADCLYAPPPLSPRTNWTSLVVPPVLTGHVSLTRYAAADIDPFLSTAACLLAAPGRAPAGAPGSPSHAPDAAGVAAPGRTAGGAGGAGGARRHAAWGGGGARELLVAYQERGTGHSLDARLRR
jgi:hypothetical protein